MKCEVRGIGALILLASLGCAGGDALQGGSQGSAVRTESRRQGVSRASAPPGNSEEGQAPEVIGPGAPTAAPQGSNTNWREIEPGLAGRPARPIIRRPPNPWDPDVVDPMTAPVPRGVPAQDPEPGIVGSPSEEPGVTEPAADDAEPTPEPASGGDDRPGTASGASPGGASPSQSSSNRASSSSEGG